MYPDLESYLIVFIKLKYSANIQYFIIEEIPSNKSSCLIVTVHGHKF